ncbi:MAG: DNA methylase [Actinomycetota bacterium]|nr:DNA methylase [Actinomycetota bacterium]
MGIEDRFDARLVAELAAAEKQVQQSYRPIIGVHKWFARRPGTLFRGLMLAELDGRPLSESFFVAHDFEGIALDPFMGGGTTLFEANRVGLSVVGYDTNPMSRWICERELEALDVAAFERAGEDICHAVEQQLDDFYTTTCEECGEQAPVKFFLWVKTHVCECGEETLLFPGPLVAGRKMKRHTHDVLVCRFCREVHQFLPDEVPDDCPGCGRTYAETKVARRAACSCGREFTVPEVGAKAPPKHTLFALEYHCPTCKRREGRRGRFFKGVAGEDHERFTHACARYAETDSPCWPEVEIPAGDETNRLHRWGYRRFRDLHNERQLLGLAILAEKIHAAPEELQPALATVFSDFVRYQNIVCRYDTAALKVLDVFSIHGYPIHRVQCEAALIGYPKVGSGGFRHFLAKYAAAKHYCQQPYETVRDGGRKRQVPIAGERIAASFVDGDAKLGEPRSAFLHCGSLTEKPMPADSVDLVLTDPPYFANVQYSELMDFCYAWLRRLMPDASFFAPPSAKSDAEVTGNTTHRRDLAAFAGSLSAVYCAAADALKPGHLFAFTYHHNDLRSYAAVVVAILDAGLVPMTTIACPSEMRGSIHISNADSSRIDTVFVLRKPPAALPEIPDAAPGERLGKQVQPLLDAGLTVSQGDRRCITYGLLADQALRRLAPSWEASAPISERLARSQATLMELLGAGEQAEAALAAGGDAN